MISPISHGSTLEQMEVFQTEPYVVAADVYGEPPHVGRGGWSWYTGSAGWMFRVAVESLMGLSIRDGKELHLCPSISADWPTCRLDYCLPACNTCYAITIENPERREHGIRSACCDGKEMLVKDGTAIVEINRDGATHEIVARL